MDRFQGRCIVILMMDCFSARGSPVPKRIQVLCTVVGKGWLCACLLEPKDLNCSQLQCSIWKVISLLTSPGGLFLCWYTDNYMDGEAKPVEPKSLINSFFHHYYTSFFVALKAFLTSHCVNNLFMCAMNNTARLHRSALKHSLIHFPLADWHKTLCQISCIELSASHKKA